MAAYQAAKAVMESLKVAYGANVDAAAKEKIYEAQRQLGDIQDTLFGLREQLTQLQDDKRELAEKLRASEAWSEREQQYELTATPGGAIVPKFKGEPTHYICPSCLNAKQIQPLQTNRTYSGKFRCTGCKAEYPIEERADPNQELRDGGGGGGSDSWMAR